MISNFLDTSFGNLEDSWDVIFYDEQILIKIGSLKIMFQ